MLGGVSYTYGVSDHIYYSINSRDERKPHIVWQKSKIKLPVPMYECEALIVDFETNNPIIHIIGGTIEKKDEKKPYPVSKHVKSHYKIALKDIIAPNVLPLPLGKVKQNILKKSKN